MYCHEVTGFETLELIISRIRYRNLLMSLLGVDRVAARHAARQTSNVER